MTPANTSSSGPVGWWGPMTSTLPPPAATGAKNGRPAGGGPAGGVTGRGGDAAPPPRRDGREERQALDVVPVEVREEDGAVVALEATSGGERLAAVAQPGSEVDTHG